MTHVINASAAVRAVVRRHESGAHQVGKELPRLLAEDDARKGRVLTHDADAGVTRNKDQKARLTLGESAHRYCLNGALEVHFKNSSASRGSGTRPPLRPFVLTVRPRPRDPRRPPAPPAPRPLITRVVPALWRLNPEDALEMA